MCSYAPKVPSNMFLPLYNEKCSFVQINKYPFEHGHCHLSCSAFWQRPLNKQACFYQNWVFNSFCCCYSCADVRWPSRAGHLLFQSVSAPSLSFLMTRPSSNVPALKHPLSLSDYQCQPSARDADLLTRDGLMPMLSAAWKARVRFRTWRRTDHTRSLKHINKPQHTRSCVALIHIASPVCVVAGKIHNAKKCVLMNEATDGF